MNVGRGSTLPEKPGDVGATACASDTDLFLHPLLEEPPTKSGASGETWSEYEALVRRARSACSACHLLADCLYKAIAQTDIAGYVGCTTPAERAAMRRLIGVRLEAEDFDAYSGARGARQPVDHDTVLRTRAAFPDDSLESIAERLDCSLSTVKRHLRRARNASSTGAATTTGPRQRLPTMDEVFDAFEQVVDQNG
jgi:hypothetical protein